MSILSLIESATGNTYRKKSSIYGGEYSGPCIFCGGTDRFSIHPEKDHFVCRQCKKAGDSITFLKDHQHKTYLEACKILNISPKISFKSLNHATQKPGENYLIWQPRQTTTPSLTWQNKAEAILFNAYKYLLSSSGKPIRDWLNARGISNDTIKTARLGWNCAQISFDPEVWGLTLEKSKNEPKRKIWIPVGLIIPYFKNGKPIRLRIRQENPVTDDRFILVAGSSTEYFDYSNHISTVGSEYKTIADKPALITESELDGWLLHSQLSSQFQIFSIGNASARPDITTHKKISCVPILLNLDDDHAGRAEVSWWAKQYPGTALHFSIMGKDPGEDYESGIDIQAWGKAGLDLLTKQKQKQDQSQGVAKPIFKAQSFKQAALSSIKKEAEPVIIQELALIDKPIIPISPTKSTTKNILCAHNLYCQSLNHYTCMIDNKNIFSLTKTCPKEKWTKWTSPSGIITEYILAPGGKKI